MSSYLDFTTIAAADDLARDVVDLPEWGGRLHVRELTVGERLQLGSMHGENPERIPAWLVAVAACKADGSALFPDRAEAEAMLSRKGKALEKAAQAVLRLSGLGDEDATEGN